MTKINQDLMKEIYSVYIFLYSGRLTKYFFVVASSMNQINEINLPFIVKMCKLFCQTVLYFSRNTK